MPIVETMRQSPISPYGWSKWCVERMLRDYAAAEPEFAFVAPRYFNVAGCAADGTLGEDHRSGDAPDSGHSCRPLLGQREKVMVFGTDYPTPDGTCIRDYIHVEDLCEAHIVAMKALRPGDARFYNLGIGRGYSVKEVIDAVQRVTGNRCRWNTVRGGPATRPCCTPTPRRSAANWAGRPGTRRSTPIVATAWNWFRNHPDGYDV